MQDKRTPEGCALSDLVLELFSLNNRILAAGDRLVADLGLTSARWQVLGTIIVAEQPRPVAWLARDMGAHRQNVQRIVNDLLKEGLVAFAPNPHHKRAQLVILTDSGKKAYEAAMRLQAPWVNDLSNSLSVKDLRTTHKVIRALLAKLKTEDQ